MRITRHEDERDGDRHAAERLAAADAARSLFRM